MSGPLGGAARARALARAPPTPGSWARSSSPALLVQARFPGRAGGRSLAGPIARYSGAAPRLGQLHRKLADLDTELASLLAAGSHRMRGEPASGRVAAPAPCSRLGPSADRGVDQLGDLAMPGGRRRRLMLRGERAAPGLPDQVRVRHLLGTLHGESAGHESLLARR